MWRIKMLFLQKTLRRQRSFAVWHATDRMITMYGRSVHEKAVGPLDGLGGIGLLASNGL